MASEIGIQIVRDTETPIVITESFNRQVVLSVRRYGDEAGPQTGDVLLEPDSAKDFSPNSKYKKNQIAVYDGRLYRAKGDFQAGDVFEEEYWEILSTTLSYVEETIVEPIDYGFLERGIGEEE